ncbi:nicotinate-nucleotide adenylyltransferase [Acidobacteriota bacterium]
MSKAQEKIGLFGGTFNPIHLGHIKAAEIVAKRFLLDKLFFIPSYIPPHKESVKIASPRHRLRMVELAVESFPHFIPSSIEIDAGGKSYSIVTLKKIKAQYPEARMLFLLGVDAFLEIETWRDYENVLEQCSFIIMSRPQFHLEDAHEVLSKKYNQRIVALSGDNAPVNIEESDNLIFLAQIHALDISSTEVRERVMRNQSIQDLVPESVEHYIKERGLYQKK